MHEMPFSKMIQPRISTTWAYNGKDTIYASYARYNPVVGSLPRAASWDRNLATTIQAYFDANGVLFATDPNISSTGKLFDDDLTPPTHNEWLIGTSRQFASQLTGRAYYRYRKGEHFWEDTNNNAARRCSRRPPGTRRDLATFRIWRLQLGRSARGGTRRQLRDRRARRRVHALQGGDARSRLAAPARAS